MILVDAGPLIAIFDRNDRDHAICVDATRQFSARLVTTWPTFTEAIYLLGSRVGWHGQDPLWQLFLRGNLVVYDLDESTTQRSYALMKKYNDVPMDLADATLVALAEALGHSRIFTLDSHFRIYRIKGRKAFDVFP